MIEKKNLYKLFPEPVFHYKLNDYKKHNENLQKYIYDLYGKDAEGVQRSNVDGWHSKSFKIVDKESPAYSFFQETKKYIISESTIKDYFNFIRPKIGKDSIYRLLSPLLNIFFGIPDSKQFKIDIHSQMKDHNFDILEKVFLKFVNEKKLIIN